MRKTDEERPRSRNNDPPARSVSPMIDDDPPLAAEIRRADIFRRK